LSPGTFDFYALNPCLFFSLDFCLVTSVVLIVFFIPQLVLPPPVFPRIHIFPALNSFPFSFVGSTNSFFCGWLFPPPPPPLTVRDDPHNPPPPPPFIFWATKTCPNTPLCFFPRSIFFPIPFHLLSFFPFSLQSPCFFTQVFFFSLIKL